MTETTTMSGAALKVRLQSMGLPPSWFANEMSVTMRTVVRWFDLDEVSPEVDEEVEALWDRTLAEMHKVLDGIDEEVDPVVLKTYRTDEEFQGPWPATWHRALISRLMDHLKAQGHNVVVEYR